MIVRLTMGTMVASTTTPYQKTALPLGYLIVRIRKNDIMKTKLSTPKSCTLNPNPNYSWLVPGEGTSGDLGLGKCY